jgi:hypothetical protein
MLEILQADQSILVPSSAKPFWRDDKVVTFDDVVAVKEQYWPHKQFYDRQWEAIQSVQENYETIIVAGNQLGKDYFAGFVVPANFICAVAKGLTCRIVTTSVKDDHLRVLWGEIGRFVTDCKRPLLHSQGGMLVMVNKEIRRAAEAGSHNPYSYVRGLVAGEGMEGLAGHHADWAIGVMDEASGLDDLAYEKMQGWMKRLLAFGNPHICSNFWRNMIKQWELEGDVLA